MRLTNQQIIESFSALTTISGLPLKPKPAYVMARNLRKIREATEDYNEARNNLLKQNGAIEQGQGFKAGDDGVIQFKTKGGRQKAEEAIAELLDVEAELALRTIDLDDFGDTEIPFGALVALGWMIVDDEEPEPDEN